MILVIVDYFRHSYYFKFSTTWFLMNLIIGTKIQKLVNKQWIFDRFTNLKINPNTNKYLIIF